MIVYLLGWQGNGNIGDDLMAELWIAENPLDSDNVYSYKRSYMIKGIKGCSLLSSIWYMIKSDKLVLSGGNALIFVRFRSYLKGGALMILFALRKALNKCTVIDSFGLDLKASVFKRHLSVFIIRFVDSVCFRDELSFRYVKFLSGLNSNNKSKYSLNIDRVLREKKSLIEMAQSNEKLSIKGSYIMWFVSGLASERNTNRGLYANNVICEIKNEILLDSCTVVLFCQDVFDRNRAKYLVSKYRFNKYIYYTYSYDALGYALKLILNSNLVITERYHGYIMAEVFDKKCFVLPVTEKLKRAYTGGAS